MGFARQRQGLRLDAEQRGDEAVEMRAERHHQVALVLRGERIRRGARRQQTRVQRGVLGRQAIEKGAIQPHQPVARRRGRRS